MSKSCNSAFVNPKTGSDKTGQINDKQYPFRTIAAATNAINEAKKCHENGKWVIFLAPCLFEENVRTQPNIFLHGADRSATIICGSVSIRNLKNPEDSCELKELTIIGQIVTSSQSHGELALFEVNVIAPDSHSPFDLRCGQFKLDSCVIVQSINAAYESRYQFYHLHGTESISLNVRNCRHERRVKGVTRQGQIFSSIFYNSPNPESVVSFQSNLYFNTFDRYFIGLLIPYDSQDAAGHFQSHSDTHRHFFAQGAGTGLKVAIED